MLFLDIVISDEETIDYFYNQIEGEKSENKRLEVLLNFCKGRITENMIKLMMFCPDPKKVYNECPNSKNFIDDYISKKTKNTRFNSVPIEIRVRCLDLLLNFSDNDINSMVSYIFHNLAHYDSFEYLLKQGIRENIFQLHEMIIKYSIKYQGITPDHMKLFLKYHESKPYLSNSLSAILATKINILTCEFPRAHLLFYEKFRIINLEDKTLFSKAARTILFEDITGENEELLKYSHLKPIGTIIALNHLMETPTMQKYKESIDAHDLGRDPATRKAIELLMENISILSEEEIESNYLEFSNLIHSHKKHQVFKRLLGLVKNDNDFTGFLTEKIFRYDPKVLIAYFWEFCKRNNCINDMISGFLNSYQFNQKWYCVCNPGKLQNLVISVLQGKLKGVEVDQISELTDYETPLSIYINFKEKIDYILAKTTECEEFFKELFNLCYDFHPELLKDIIRILCLYSEGKNGFEINPDFSIVSSLANSFLCTEYTHLIEQIELNIAENEDIQVEQIRREIPDPNINFDYYYNNARVHINNAVIPREARNHNFTAEIMTGRMDENIYNPKIELSQEMLNRIQRNISLSDRSLEFIENDILLVQSQSGGNLNNCINTYIDCDGDIINAIMALAID